MKHLKYAYILSWFGNEDIREKRKRYHAKQVKWFLDKGLDVVILPQQYNEDDFIENDRITYLSAPPTLLRPASGRNLLLKHFYDSDYDFAVIADNDAMLEKYNLGYRCIDDLDNNFEYYSDVDFFIPANNYGGKPVMDIKEDPVKQENYVFTRTSSFLGAFAFLRNIKKYYGLEIYYDTYFDNKGGKMIPGEDSDFGMQLIVNGFGAYKCNSIILYEPGGQANSTWEKESRLADRRLCSQYLLKKYRQFGVKYAGDGTDNNCMNFLNKKFMKPYPVHIPIDKDKLKQITIRKPSRITYNISKWIGEING